MKRYEIYPKYFFFLITEMIFKMRNQNSLNSGSEVEMSQFRGFITITKEHY